MLRLLRKGFLVYVLVLVAGGHWLTVQRTTSWDDTLWVAVHPINGDGSARSAEYIARLTPASFEAIAEFMTEEASHHGVSLAQPFRLVLGAEVRDQPPMPPGGGGTLEVMLWSLKMRYWAWRVDCGRIRRPATSTSSCATSTRMTIASWPIHWDWQKGLVGVVNAFASRRQSASNHVVIAHELLHTVGASDKYHPATAQPVHPDGYAEPDAEPRFPQELAELMGGRIPLSASESRMPRFLNEVVVGDSTASEIRWGR